MDDGGIIRMQEIINYKHINQKRFCCVPVCIQMILKRHKIKSPTQEEIGKELGLIIPEGYKKIFPSIKTGKRPPAGYGTRVNMKKCSTNNFFKKYKIPLKETYFPLKRIENIKRFILENIKKSNDIIVCFNYKKLYNFGNEGGHVSIVNSFNKNKISLIDPSKKFKKLRKVNLLDLVNSIRYHGENKRAGFWVISKKIFKKHF